MYHFFCFFWWFPWLPTNGSKSVCCGFFLGGVPVVCYMAMGQKPNRTRPVNIRFNPTNNIGSKMGGEFTYPKNIYPQPYRQLGSLGGKRDQLQIWRKRNLPPASGVIFCIRVNFLADCSRAYVLRGLGRGLPKGISIKNPHPCRVSFHLQTSPNKERAGTAFKNNK